MEFSNDIARFCDRYVLVISLSVFISSVPSLCNIQQKCLSFLATAVIEVRMTSTHLLINAVSIPCYTSEFYHNRASPWVWILFTNSLNNDCTSLCIVHSWWYFFISMMENNFLWFELLLKERGIGVFSFTTFRSFLDWFFSFCT